MRTLGRLGTYIICQLWHRDAGLSFVNRLRKKKTRHLPCFLKSRRRRVWHRSHSERMESATCCGMESRFSEYGINANCIVWNQERRGTENTACRLIIKRERVCACASEPRADCSVSVLPLAKHARSAATRGALLTKSTPCADEP